jgi:hypothetical protein
VRHSLGEISTKWILPKEPSRKIGGEKGAKHKTKEKEKKDKKSEKADDDRENKSESGNTEKKKEKSKKKSKKSKEEAAKMTDGLKKPLSAYMLYTNHRRPALKKDYPCTYYTLIY